MTERGGPQRIPRPDDWRPGGPPPWLDADVAVPTMADIEELLIKRGSGRIRGRSQDGIDRRSAVLVPLYEEDGEVHVVLTRRSPNLRSHTHEVAFPGGRVDPDDATVWDAAVREAHEEIDLDPELPQRIGELDTFVTGGSMSLVTPYVARLPERPQLTPHEAEVEHILHVPLAELFLPEAWREELWHRDGVLRRITFFELHGDTVWGATGAMLRQLLALLSGVEDDVDPA